MDGKIKADFTLIRISNIAFDSSKSPEGSKSLENQFLLFLNLISKT